MRLHRLVLTNYRGIDHREIAFPDDGVVVVYGPNEIGKSSMIEALDLLLESKDRSAKKDVKQVQPTNADVGAEVTAEISTGPHRFVYRKRFHKRPETELTVLQPQREQLTGDEAHARVRQIIDDTVDSGLWRAQRVLQATSTDLVDLSGCDALSRALDIAAGDSAPAAGNETALIDEIEDEYAVYFTKTGRPTGGWADAIAALGGAERDVDRWTEAVGEVEERIARHAELTEELAELDRGHDAIAARCAAAESDAKKVAALTTALNHAQLQSATAAAGRDKSAAAHAERIRRSGDIDTRTAALEGLAAEAEAAGMAAATAEAQRNATETELARATAVLEAARQREETARRIVDRLVDLDEADRLAGQLTRIGEAVRDRDQLAAELVEITLTEALLAHIESAAAAVDVADARLAAISATVDVTAAAEVELLIEGDRVALATGQAWTATAPTAIEIPGLLTVRVSPGEMAAKAQTGHAAAVQQLAAALKAGGVADLDAARETDRRRRELQARRDKLEATRAALCGDVEPDRLRERVAQLRAAQPVDDELTDTDSAAARAELAATTEARARAAAAWDRQRAAAADATAKATENATRATMLQENLETARVALAADAQRLADDRQVTTDAALAGAAAADEETAQTAEQHVAELSAELAAAGPEAVAAELAAATAAADELGRHRDQTDRELDRLTTELAVLGREGRQGRLAAAEADYAHAAAEHAHIGRRARAAQLLRSVMLGHRDDARKRYVEPFRTEIQRLGRTVFGPSFEVEIDSELRIANRTLDGCTVPYESLSGGAKEQLGILTRLAGAALVAKEDTVPVLIDDALGFTDPDRLASMATVFDAVGANGQVIVLTCTPDRYDKIVGAHHISLGT